MNLGDPEWELVDPTPNVHSLFVHFDQVFFWTKLVSRTVVRWSKRMYSCAGTCTYARGGICDIALSEPLLKLRPRKDLVETLLHEMIHAYLFITCQDRDRDGHGPNFKEHMYRINKAAGLNISIYHDFHDEVNLYRTHWWRCNGPCHSRKPYFGIVRRTANRPPGPSDLWWKDHQRKCGGTFIKIKEPENFGKKQKEKISPKPIGDISKYIIKNTNNDIKNDKPVLKDLNKLPVKSSEITKRNNSSTIVVSKKNNIVFNPQNVRLPTAVFNGKGHILSGKSKTVSADDLETVRNIWANKQVSPSMPDKSISANSETSRKQKAEDIDILSPPAKIKKIDDYFKSTATSLLKDLYGNDFEIKDTNEGGKKFLFVPILDLVDCPVCKEKIKSKDINKHLDECLNKEIIENISTEIVDPAMIKIKSETYNDNKNIEKGNTLGQVPIGKNEIVNSTNVIFDNKVNDLGNFQDTHTKGDIPAIKIEPGTIKDTFGFSNEQKCPCCGKIVNKPINEHLDDCLAFDNDTVPTEGASTSSITETIVIDDEDDILDETQTLNATGTKTPCPCCLTMIELNDMNDHLDLCLS